MLTVVCTVFQQASNCAMHNVFFAPFYEPLLAYSLAEELPSGSHSTLNHDHPIFLSNFDFFLIHYKLLQISVTLQCNFSLILDSAYVLFFSPRRRSLKRLRRTLDGRGQVIVHSQEC